MKSSTGLLWGPKLVRVLYDHWSWLYVFYVFLAWEVRRLAWILWWKAPVLIRKWPHLACLLIIVSVQRHSLCISDASR